MLNWKEQAKTLSEQTLTEWGQLLEKTIRSQFPQLLRSLEGSEDLEAFCLVQQADMKKQYNLLIEQRMPEQSAREIVLTEFMRALEPPEPDPELPIYKEYVPEDETKPRPMPLIRLDLGNGLIIYPLMPGDAAYKPEYDDMIREMMAAKAARELKEEQQLMESRTRRPERCG